MVRTVKGVGEVRIRCPHGPGSCDGDVAERNWTHAPVTDHRCPNGHWFRIEGDDPERLEDFKYYEIRPNEIRLEYMV